MKKITFGEEASRIEQAFGDFPETTATATRTVEVHRRPNECPARVGRDHDFSMKGSDGNYRCWYCCKTRARVEDDTKKATA